jgi:putative PIN family toxin of toxin-antitoxin system
MRVVPDTNVLVSGIVFGGPPGEIMALAAARQLQLLLSPPLITELRRVLREKFEFGDDALYLAETLVRRAGIVVEPTRTLMLITEDPEDNRVLEVAAEGKADVIVSGDRHLLTLRVFEGIPIMSPRQLLDRLG